MKPSSCLREFAKYSTFNVMGMIGLSCYILADTFFVSKGLGANGLAALNLAIPIYSFIHGSGLMIGMGGGTIHSIRKSEKRRTAKQTGPLRTRYTFALLFAVFFVLIGIFFSGSITTLLDADDSVFSMSKTYLQVILLFARVFNEQCAAVLCTQRRGSTAFDGGHDRR